MIHLRKIVTLVFIGSCSVAQASFVQAIQPKVEDVAHLTASVTTKAKDMKDEFWQEVRDISKDMKEVFHDMQQVVQDEINQLEKLRKSASNILFGSNIATDIVFTENQDVCVIEISGITNQEGDAFRAVASYNKNDQPVHIKISNLVHTIDIEYNEGQCFVQVHVHTEAQANHGATDAERVQTVVPAAVSARSLARSIKNILLLEPSGLVIDYSKAQEKMTISIPVVRTEVKTKLINVVVK